MNMLLAAFLVVVSLIQGGSSQCTIASTNNDILVSCSGLHLASVPLSVPDDVTHLDLSYNVIRYISFLTFRRFSRIRSLNLTNNEISHVDRNAFASLQTLEELDLQFNDIGDSVLRAISTTEELKPRHALHNSDNDNENSKAEGNAHGDAKTGTKTRLQTSEGICAVLLPRNLRVLRLNHNLLVTLAANCFRSCSQSLETLSLSNNQLETIPSDSFRHLAQLQTLHLDGNRLQRLEPYALRGLNRLHTLLLSANRLRYDETSFPSGVFAPVKDSLARLHLHDNDVSDIFDGSYPESAFSDLTSLTYLSLATFPLTNFGHGISAMRRLTSLDLSQNCRLRTLTNQTFLAFENGSLENLYVSDCNGLIYIDACAFCPLKALFNLQMDDTYSKILDLNVVFRAFYGFQHRNNLTEVNLHRLSFHIRTSVRMTVHTMRYVLNTCVRSLHLGDDYITSIEKGALGWPGSPFSECIEHIDVSNNRFWHIDFMAFAIEFARLPRLESLAVNNQKSLDMSKAMELMVSRKEIHRISDKQFQLHIALPRELRFINMSSLLSELGQLPLSVKFKNGEKMKILDMSYVRMYGCMTTILGLDHLETFNLSGNSCNYISDNFFDSFSTLKTLVLQKMNFDPLLFAKQGSVLFRNLSRLEALDLSDNDLRHLPFDMLHSQSDLRELRLTRNKLNNLSLDVSHCGNLTMLDVSNNAISQLNNEERVRLDELALRQPQPFRLHLHGNPLACTCDTLDFLHWLHTTSIRLDNGGDYPCMTDSGEKSTTAAVVDHWPLAWRRCVGHTALWTSLLAMLLMLSLLGAVWAVAVNTTRLQFLFRVLKKIKMPMRQQFVKEAYVAYCEDDTEWVCTRLKESLQDDRQVNLLIKHLPRNQEGTLWWELPGENSPQKMLEHMDLCWKVVLVLTPNLALDTGSGFMTRAVLQTITDTMPDRVLLLGVGVTRVPGLASLRALLEVVPENQVFFVPAQAERHHPVWDRVAEIILR